MSETTTTGAVTYNTEAKQETVKVSYNQALGNLEKQHRLSKLQCEIAEFRAREVQANMFYLDLLRKANSAEQPQAKMQVQAETSTSVPQEEKLSETVSN